MKSSRIRSTTVPIRIPRIHAKEESQLEEARNPGYLSLLATLMKPTNILPRGCQVEAFDAPKRPHLLISAWTPCQELEEHIHNHPDMNRLAPVGVPLLRT